MGRDYTKPKEKKKGQMKRGAPIIGLVMAVSLAVFAYVIAGPVVTFAEGQGDVKSQFDDLREQYGGDSFPRSKIVELIIAALLWFALMGISMTIVSAALVGTDPDRDAWKQMGASPANKKAMIKQMKKDLKDAKRRAKQKPKS